MDRIVYYEHYFGRIEDLKNKDTTRLKKIDDINYSKIENASKSFGSSLIIIPRFVGTYQENYIKADTQEEKKYQKGINEQKKELELLVNKILKTRDNDSINPNLIHVCYDQEQYTKDIVRWAFGEGSSRLGISNYKDLPNFYDKNSALVSIYTDKITGTDGNKNIKEEIKTISEDGFDRFQLALREFGLTLNELSFFEILGKLRSISSSKTMESNILFTDITSEIFEK